MRQVSQSGWPCPTDIRVVNRQLICCGGLDCAVVRDTNHRRTAAYPKQAQRKLTDVAVTVSDVPDT